MSFPARTTFCLAFVLPCVAVTTLYQVKLPETYKDIGGRCLDGSMADYYYRQGSNASKVWLFYLQGGGSCADEVRCQDRSRTTLGSSNSSATLGNQTTVDLPGGLFSLDQSENPDFATAHKVYVPYRSGDAHLGTHTEAHPDWGVWFSGHLNLVHIIDHLKSFDAENGILSAERVLVTGSSAGGVGTFYNAEWFDDEAFPDAIVKAVPISGVAYAANVMNATWPDYVNGTTRPPRNDSVVADLYQSYVPPSCVTALESVEACTPMDILAHTDMSFFVVDAQFDNYFLRSNLLFPEEAEDTVQGQEYIRWYGDLNRQAHETMDNVFSVSCMDHSSGFNTYAPSTILFNGNATLNSNDIIRDWFMEINALPHKLVESRTQYSPEGLPGNPSCRTRLGDGADGPFIPTCAQACIDTCYPNGDLSVPNCACLESCDLSSCSATVQQNINDYVDQTCPGAIPHCFEPCALGCAPNQDWTNHCTCLQSCDLSFCSAVKQTHISQYLDAMCS